MAVSISCDLCGEAITREFIGEVQLRVVGVGVHGDVGHYHNTLESPCWSEMLDRIRMIHEVSADLGFKPTPVARQALQRQSLAERAPRIQRHEERRRKWTRLHPDERADIILKVLGDDALTAQQIADLVNDGYGVDKDEDDIEVLHAAEARRIAQRLVRDGKVLAATENVRNNLRYRFSRISEAVA